MMARNDDMTLWLLPAWVGLTVMLKMFKSCKVIV